MKISTHEALKTDHAQLRSLAQIGPRPAPQAANAEGVEPVVPQPDEYAVSVSDEPSEGRALREQQDEAAKGSQDSNDWVERESFQ